MFDRLSIHCGLDHPKLFAYLRKGSNGLVEVVAFVACRNLHPDAGLALRHHREIEAYDVNTSLQQGICHFLGQYCIIKHNGYNGMLPGFDIETSSSHFLAEIEGIFLQLVTQVSRFRE